MIPNDTREIASKHILPLADTDPALVKLTEWALNPVIVRDQIVPPLGGAALRLAKGMNWLAVDETRPTQLPIAGIASYWTDRAKKAVAEKIPRLKEYLFEEEHIRIRADVLKLLGCTTFLGVLSDSAESTGRRLPAVRIMSQYEPSENIDLPTEIGPLFAGVLQSIGSSLNPEDSYFRDKFVDGAKLGLQGLQDSWHSNQTFEELMRAGNLNLGE